MQLLDGGHGRRLDLESEARRETNGAQHSQMIFLEALLRIADRANDADRARSARPPT